MKNTNQGLVKKIFLLLILTISSYAMSGKNMTVYKSPYCGCCTKWVDIMKTKGFNVTVKKVDNVMAVNEKLGITPQTASCHTALVDGYVVVGHVDYSAIKKMILNKPDILGITVPGMPVGSPGMEQDNMKQKYNVLFINKNGSTGVYEKH